MDKADLQFSYRKNCMGFFPYVFHLFVTNDYRCGVELIYRQNNIQKSVCSKLVKIDLFDKSDIDAMKCLLESGLCRDEKSKDDDSFSYTIYNDNKEITVLNNTDLDFLFKPFLKRVKTYSDLKKIIIDQLYSELLAQVHPFRAESKKAK